MVDNHLFFTICGWTEEGVCTVTPHHMIRISSGERRENEGFGDRDEADERVYGIYIYLERCYRRHQLKSGVPSLEHLKHSFGSLW